MLPLFIARNKIKTTKTTFKSYSYTIELISYAINIIHKLHICKQDVQLQNLKFEKKLYSHTTSLTKINFLYYIDKKGN